MTPPRPENREGLSTTHDFLSADSAGIGGLVPGSVGQIVTSPPYPMVKMWDATFAGQSHAVAAALETERCGDAFEAMHQVLDKVWAACVRALRDGGFACINVGDAVRTCGGTFQLFSNHTRIIQSLQSAGMTLLPAILWRKPTNSPTKFMGSGMLPAGAYVTLEHEYVIVARKGAPRRPDSREERMLRRQSSLFWEERNQWFSDLWQFTGTRQELTAGAGRNRSAAYPLELPYRLVAMYSIMGDTVLDPFSGTGTTSLAAMALARNSIAIDVDAELTATAYRRGMHPDTTAGLAARNRRRIADHLAFLARRDQPVKHSHARKLVPVVTSQETDMIIPLLSGVTAESLDEPGGAGRIRCGYTDEAWSS
ncbi:MAG: site-specific DNA-methyltransferase [Spirochaetales bacterium]|nr:MAG: site-specific DNA-methyltransferase [Spirochaetales bacterium]